MTRTSIALTLLLAAAACGSDHDGETLAHQIDDARAHVDELRAEIDGHADAALAATDLAMLQGMEGPHRDAMTGHMDDLGHAIGDMSMCDGALDDRVDAMMSMHDDCDEERGRHQDSAAATTSLDEAFAEEERHRGQMIDCLDELDGMMHGIMTDHGEAMCRGHHGMDDHDRP